MPYAPLGYQLPFASDEELAAMQEQLARDRGPLLPGRVANTAPAPTVATSGITPQLGALMHALGGTGDQFSTNLARQGLPPSINTQSILDALYKTGEGGPRLIQKAGEKADIAYRDPSIQNIARAGAYGGMAAMRPGVALPAAAVDFGTAALRDMGVIGGEGAQAQDLTDRQKRAQEIKRQDAEREAAAAAAARTQEGKLKGEAEERAARIRGEEADAARARELKAAQDADALATYTRMKTRAEERRATELGRQKHFSETALGEVFNDYGASAPYLAGGVAGGALRLGQIGKGAYTPIKAALLGAAGGLGASNWPLISDAYITPPGLNPEVEGAKAYVQEAPDKDPFRQRMIDYLATNPPAANPVRTQAKEELVGPYGLNLLERSLLTGAEGAFGGEVSYNTLHGLAAMSRIPAWLRSQYGGGGPPLSPAPPVPLTPAAPAIPPPPEQPPPIPRRRKKDLH